MRGIRNMNELPAFELASGERIMLTGGFGGIFGWTWSLPFLLIVVMIGLVFIHKGQVTPDQTREGLEFMLIFGAIGIWPFARSGRYYLTNQRLIWRPRLGRSLVIGLASIPEDGLKVKPSTSSLRVRFGNRKVTLRYISGLERLWGGILLNRAHHRSGKYNPGHTHSPIAWSGRLGG